jgi:hypothetical protein
MLRQMAHPPDSREDAFIHPRGRSRRPARLDDEYGQESQATLHVSILPARQDD